MSIAPSKTLQFVYSNSCSHYRIFTKHPLWNVSFRLFTKHIDHISLFYIKQLPCPSGFVIIDLNVCVATPMLQQFGIAMSCDTSTQSVSQPA